VSIATATPVDDDDGSRRRLSTTKEIDALFLSFIDTSVVTTVVLARSRRLQRHQSSLHRPSMRFECECAFEFPFIERAVDDDDDDDVREKTRQNRK